MIDLVLEMRSVGKWFPCVQGRAHVLHDVNLSIAPGEFVSITGPSGSGKSTCLHLAALLDQPSIGQLIFNGKDTSRISEQELCRLRKYQVGMVFQKYFLLPHRSVLENVLFRFRYTEVDGLEQTRRAKQTLAMLDLDGIHDRAVRLLSGGEMQRVAIARAVALQPKLLIADEPTGNLDHCSAMGVMTYFERLNRAGLTILMVTHNESLMKFCSRHITCRNGSLYN